MKKKLIKNDVLCWYDLYLLEWTRKECDKFVSKIIWEVETQEFNDAMHYYIPRTSIICIYEDKNIWKVLHELNHFIQRMLEMLNIPHDSNNTELVSNLWEYYWERTLNFYGLTTIRNNKSSKN